MKPKSSLRSFLAICGSLFVASPLHAITLYWDGTTSTANADGGVGTWDTSATNWDTAAFAGSNATWNNTTPDFAVFGGTAGTVTLGTPITTAGLRFDTTGYILDASTNALSFGAANNSILFSKVAAATITGAIGGSGNVTLGSANATSGASFITHTLNLNGTSAGGWSGTTTVNQFTTLALAGLHQGLASTTGGITLNGGGITLTNVAAQAALDRVNASAITSNGGTITYANTATASTAYAETIGAVALTSGQLNLVLSTNQNAATNSQTLTLGGLTQAGTSAVTFSAATTAPNATTNIISVTGAAAGFIGPWATTGTTAALQTDYAVYNASSQVVGAAIGATAENSGSWVGGANVTLSGATTLTATRTVNTLRYSGAAGALGLGAAAFNLETYGVLNGGSGLLTVSTTGTGSLTTPTGGGNLYLTSGNNAITVSAPIKNNGGTVTVVQSGNGNLTLSSTTSNFSGGIVINSGRLVTTADTNLGSGGGITVNGNATWSAGSITYARNITLNNGAILSFDGGNPVVSGNVTGTGGVANANGFGNQVTLSGTTNTFEGPVFIGSTGVTGQAYRFQLSSLADSTTANGRIVFRASTVTHADGSVFQYNGGTNLTLANRQIEIASSGSTPTNGHQIRSSGAGTLSISTDLLVSSTSAQTLRLGGTNTSANNIYSGVISNGTSSAVTLQKVDAGTWTLTNNNTHTGGTTTTAGKLNINHAGALGTGTFTIGAGTFDNTTASTIINANNNAIAWNNDATFTGTRSLDLGTGNAVLGGNRSIVVSANTLTMGGVVSGAFNITLGGNGRLALTNAASTYTGKTVVGNDAGSSLTIQVSKLADLSTNSSLGAPTTAANGLIQLGSISRASTLDYIGTSASSTDRQIQVGSTSNGSGGSLINNNSVSSSHTLTFSNPAFNVAAGATATLGRGLTLGGSNTGDNTITGAIINNTGGTIAVNKSGAGTWVLNGTSSFTGAVAVTNGILKVNSIKDSGTNSAVGAGTLIALGAGSTTGTLTYTGSGDSASRSIRVGSGTVGEIGGGVINNNGTGSLNFTTPTFNTAVAGVTVSRNLSLGGTYTTTANDIQGDIVDNDTGTGGTVSITKSDAGTWTLSGDNTYTGVTTVSGGTLLINGNSSTANGNVNVNAGTLGGTGATGGAVAVAGGATLAPGASIESLAAASLSMVAASTFAYEVANNTSTGADLLAVSGTITLSGVTLGLDASSLAALAGGGWSGGDKLTLISYLGADITSGFTGYLDDTSYFFGLNEWFFDYNDTSAGDNYAADATAAGQNRFITMTLVPEPNTALLGGLGLLVLLRRRR